MLPKKPRNSKSKKISINERQQWEAIIKTVSKEEVPVELLESLTVNLLDGTCVELNISMLIAKGKRPRDIEEYVNEKLSALSDSIVDVDFFINVDKVSNLVTPITNSILKKI